ncbi:MAG: hypothetical protein HC914_09805 [Chloroflexaceae bacterium]|nr:hypothetical protein [Chloroflexaceae bacterium]
MHGSPTKRPTAGARLTNCHQARRRQVPWQLLAWLSQRAIISVMQQYGL